MGKSFNDSFGYAFGGLLIQEITAFLESIEDAEIYHIKGVEFIIIVETTYQQ